MTNTYKRVSKNICKENNSYRVRCKLNGVMHSKNFTTRKEAIAYRDSLMKQLVKNQPKRGGEN